jgi:hypothetical protein
MLTMLGLLRIIGNHLYLCFVNGTAMPGWKFTCAMWSTEYLKPTVETYCSEIDKSFLNIIVHLVTQALG